MTRAATITGWLFTIGLISVVATTTSPPTTTATSTQRPSPGNTDAVRPGPPDNTVVVVVCVVFGLLLIAGTVIGVVIYRRRWSRKTCAEVLDERPYTTLQHGASVLHEYGVIRNDTTQGTCTSQSKT
ncbi:uncharacterized protein LOC124269516 [Haliotis rubra]|uniref:uncharacterized protein LOC124269516 n=1 Tax=Haliotis rubra TaxID=36100 RepID=UPI001EE58080|nr:uncharacterized protein LOC124269516 [Haliotis rubra]